jgi:hypothetical protein
MANLTGYAAPIGPFDENTWGVEFVFDEDEGQIGTHTVLVRPERDRIPKTGRKSGFME